MSSKYYLLCTTLLCGAALSLAQQTSTPQGSIKGFFKKTVNGRQVEAYLGIPYAKPPVEELRYKNPEPFGKWTGERNAVKEGPMCIQKSVFSTEGADSVGLTGDEDCLYLNVYTPSSLKQKKYPVMFFIHGGGFHGGTGNPILYEPDFLLDKDVVLVTINYRLGPLGFLSTEDFELPGNFGLKDQTLALKWVQENIAYYGGNPRSVTIFGQSAGGSSVHYHMISPLSKDLFHRGIAISGCAHCPWALSPPGVNAKRTKKLASLVGCPTEPSALLVECMRNIPAYLLIDMMDEFLVWHVDPIIVFPPVIEPKNVPGAFLTVDPFDTPSTLPLMVGFTSEDGALRIALFKSTDTGLEKNLEIFNENFNDLAPLALMYEDSAENKDDISCRLKKFYFGEKNISREILPEVTNLFTDMWFAQCAMSFVRKHKGPAYLYYFAHKSEYSFTHKQANSKEDLGISHGDDLLYLFPLAHEVDRTKGLSDADKKMREELVTLYTNFAIHGNPTPEESNKGSNKEQQSNKGKSKLVKWNPVSLPNINYYHIEGGKTKMEQKNLLEKRMDFWRNLPWRPNSFSSKSFHKDEL